jgi:hypothetical protein
MPITLKVFEIDIIIIISFYSYKLDGSDDIHGRSGDRVLDPLPVRGHSEVHHQKRAANGENPFGVHTQRIPGKRSRVRFRTVIARILSSRRTVGAQHN